MKIEITVSEAKVILEALNEYGEIADNHGWYDDIALAENIETKLYKELHKK